MKSFFTSPRFLAVVGHSLSIAAIAILNDIAANLSIFNLPSWGVAVLGILLAQIIAALKSEGVVAGFSGK